MLRVEKRNGKVFLVTEREASNIDIDNHIKRINHEIKNIEHNILGLQQRKENLLSQLSKLTSIKQEIEKGAGPTDPALPKAESLPVDSVRPTQPAPQEVPLSSEPGA